jgi:electron transfer flavoprotein beta subunit
VEALRRALALGASRAVRIDGAAPADPRHLAALLAAAIRHRGYDLVLTGAQSSDLGWGLTGTSLAAALGWPHVWLVIGIEAEADAAAPTEVAARLLVTRELEHRRRERSRVALPAVLCVQTGLHGPRMPRIRDLLEAKRRGIETLATDELAREAAQAPMAAALELVSWTRPGAGGSAELCAGSPADAARELVRRLRADGLVPERR